MSFFFVPAYLYLLFILFELFVDKIFSINIIFLFCGYRLLLMMIAILTSPISAINDSQINHNRTTIVPIVFGQSSTNLPNIKFRDPTTISRQNESSNNKSENIYESIKVYNKVDVKSKRMLKKTPEVLPQAGDWQCPNISQSRNLECGCDMPHTLRCSGDIHSLKVCLIKSL